MLLSFALIILIGFSLKGIFEKLRIPGLLGMLAAGILLGPHVLNLVAPEILDISADLREIALIIILLRVGLSLDLKDLKRVGRPAFLMCFVPACFEIAGVVLLAPLILGITVLEAAVLGTVLAAVSPAVIIPRMLRLMEAGYGIKKSVPQLILAGASVDDIFNIVLFTAFMGLAAGGEFEAFSIAQIPLSIITGLIAGIAAGFLATIVFKKLKIRDTVKVLMLIGASLALVAIDGLLPAIIPYSGLPAVMALGGTVLKNYETLAHRISGKFSKVWVAAELLLFVMLGTAVDIRYAVGAGFGVILLILAVLVFRFAGVWISLLATKLNVRERLFCVIAYLPKATVQAAIGSLPLAAGLSAGPIILTAAVLSILITAPLGAIGIDLSYKHLLAAPDDNKKPGPHQPGRI